MSVFFKVKDKNKSEYRLNTVCNLAKLLLSRTLTPSLAKGPAEDSDPVPEMTLQASQGTGLSYSFSLFVE